jgi:hypothetical protein
MLIRDFVITTQHPRLVEYVDGLQRKNAEALSFYPKSCFEREQKQNRLVLGILNGEPCGYIYHGALGVSVKIHQVCIQFDVRRKLYGAYLVGEVERKALEKGCSLITLRCGFDLEANQFWQELGYGCIGVVDGGIRRQRKINIWQKALSTLLMPCDLVIPAEGKTDVSFWRNNKQVGLVTQFARGKQMRQYAELLKNKVVD